MFDLEKLPTELKMKIFDLVMQRVHREAATLIQNRYRRLLELRRKRALFRPNFHPRDHAPFLGSFRPTSLDRYMPCLGAPPPPSPGPPLPPGFPLPFPYSMELSHKKCLESPKYEPTIPQYKPPF